MTFPPPCMRMQVVHDYEVCQTCSNCMKHCTCNKDPLMETTTVDFSEALRALKVGARIQRAGWNGKGMWLSLTPGRKIPSDNFWSPSNRTFAAGQPDAQATVLPYITMKTADDCIVPWLASQTDVLANDWIILPA